MLSTCLINSNKFITVIIPTYRDWFRLSRCLEALDKQTLPSDSFEIIIVNNDPGDIPPADYRFPDNAILLSEDKQGSYAARNRALLSARGDVLAFTDSDCQPRKDWLACAIRCLGENENVSRVGGKIELMLPTDKPLSPIQIYEKVFAFRQMDYVEEQGMAATANMIAKKSVFENAGLFDDSLMSGGDAEWGIRANRLGHKIVYCSSCVVLHPTRNSFAEVVQKARREIGGQFLLEKNKHFARRSFDVILGILPPVRSIKKVIFSKNYTLREKIIAVSLRYVLRLIVHYEKALLLLSFKKVERI